MSIDYEQRAFISRTPSLLSTTCGRPLVSVVIVSYNTREETLACLASLKAQTVGFPHEVIVLDNASPDGSADAIRRAHPDIRLIESKDNLGFAGGNNVAAKYATADHILLLNPDTIILDRAIERLVDVRARQRRRPRSGAAARCLAMAGSIRRAALRA